MADPTPAQKLAAMKAALSTLGVTDADEADRAVAAFWSQQALVPQAPPGEVAVDYARLEAFIAETVAKAFVERFPAESPVMVTTILTGGDAGEKAQVKDLGDKALTLMKLLLLKGE